MDPFKYREIVGTFTARLPDGGDSDQLPDRVPLNGYGTLRPNIRGTSVVFTEVGEFAVPRTRQVAFVDGELMVEVVDGESSILQPLFLEVTVDERANQEWSWTLTFDSLTIGEWGEEISHPALSFPVEDGDGPLELSTVATTVTRTANFVSRGAPGAGLQEITAADGEIVFAWDNGRTTAIGVPDAVPGPTGDKGDPGAKGDSGDVRFEGIDPGITVRTDDVLIGDTSVPSSSSSTVMHEVYAPDYAWAVTDEDGQVALGVHTDGTVSGADSTASLPYDVILLAGQSNMQGRGDKLLDRDPILGVDQYPAANRPESGSIIPAVDPLLHRGSINAATPASLAMPFARKYRQENPGRRVLLVPAAYGATAFSSTTGAHWDWTVSTGTPLAPLAVQQTKDALAAAGPSARLAGILWHQGEGDLGIYEQYPDKLDGLINYFRTELDAPDVPVVVGQMSMDRALVTSRVAVDAAHQQTPARVVRSAFAPSPLGLHNPGDATHFSTRALDIMGLSFYEGLRRAEHNVPGTVPLGPESVRAERVGDTTRVSWDPAWARVTEYRVEWRTNGGAWSEAGVDLPLSVGRSATISAAADEVRVTSMNDTGTSPAVVSPVSGSSGAQQASTTIAPTTDWRTDLDTEVTAYRDGNVVSVAAWRLAANADVTGSVVAYQLPLGYQPAGWQQYQTVDSRSASVRLSYDGTVTVSDPSGAVAHHAFTFITLDPMPQ